MVTRVIILLGYLALVSSTPGNRERQKCTLSIFENTTNSKESEFFNHVEQFFQKHEIGKVLSSFLDKGDLTVAMKHKLTADNDVNFEFLRISTGSGEKDFLVSALRDTSKRQFLESVRHAFFTAYYDDDSEDNPSEKFDAMLEDSVISSYFEIIQTRPLIINTEMLVTNIDIHLNSVEISSTDNANCFLNQYQESELSNQVISAYQDEEQEDQQKTHRISMAPRRFYNEDKEAESRKICSSPAKEKTKTYIKRGIVAKVPCINKNYKSEGRYKKRIHNYRTDKTRSSCLREKPTKRRLPNRAKDSCQTSKRINPFVTDNFFNNNFESESEEGNEYDSNDETKDEDRYDGTEERKRGSEYDSSDETHDKNRYDGTGKRSNKNKKAPATQTESVLYRLIMKEISNLGKNKKPSKRSHTSVNQPKYDNESEDCDEDETLSKHSRRNIPVPNKPAGNILHRLIMDEVNELGKTGGSKRTHPVKKQQMRKNKTKNQGECDDVDAYDKIGMRRLTEEPGIEETRLIAQTRKYDREERMGDPKIKKIENKKNKAAQKHVSKIKSFTIELDKLS